MYTTTKLRILRLKYRISLKELAEKGGVSNQQISRLEFGLQSAARKERLAETALGKVIAARKAELSDLEQEYLFSKGRLLQPMEVDGNEL